MIRVKAIKTEADRKATLARIDALMDGEDRPAAETEELTVLAALVEAYERRNFPIALPTPIEAIRFRMEQLGLDAKDLARQIGSRRNVSDVLAGKRRLSLPMIRALHKNLGISADVLLQDETNAPERGLLLGDASNVDWGRRTPLK